MQQQQQEVLLSCDGDWYCKNLQSVYKSPLHMLKVASPTMKQGILFMVDFYAHFFLLFWQLYWLQITFSSYDFWGWVPFQLYASFFLCVLLEYASLILSGLGMVFYNMYKLYVFQSYKQIIHFFLQMLNYNSRILHCSVNCIHFNMELVIIDLQIFKTLTVFWHISQLALIALGATFPICCPSIKFKML